MTRWEARTALAAALLMVTAALTWLLGPWGLLAPGLLLALVVLFLVDVKEQASGEAVADPVRTYPGGGPVRR